jgi:hypothetical protein
MSISIQMGSGVSACFCVGELLLLHEQQHITSVNTLEHLLYAFMPVT